MRPRSAVVTAVTLVASVILHAGPAGADPDHGGDPTVPAPPPGPGPQPVIAADGTWAVGADILPGVYASAGPVEGDTCYWRRIGAEDATLENALTKKPQVVQIHAADVAFKTNGCQPWQLTDGVAPPGQTPPWLAQLQLRQHLDILNGLARQSGNGQLPPY